MEDLENEKGVYWIIFFIVLALVAVLGHYFVFNYSNEKEKKKDETKEEDQINVNDYIGIWQLIYEESDTPEKEVCINVVDGSTITFDYFIKDGVYFDSQTAHLDGDTATFEMVDRKNEVSVEGKIVFKNDKLYFTVTSSSSDEVLTGTYQFTDKGDESLLN